MYKKPPSSAPPPLLKSNHLDFERNNSDALKLITFWQPKVAGHRSQLRFHMSDSCVYLTYNRVIGGLDTVHSSPHSFNQPWADFRGSVTSVMRYCEILGERDDSQASGEWRRTHGVKVTKTRNSYHELFDP